MRLFGNRNSTEEPNPNTEPDPQEPQTEPEEEVPNPEPQEPELPDDADLGALYDENGEARFQLDDGTPCSEDGTPIPARRPEAQQETTPEPEPAPKPTFRSPFADGILSDEERLAAEAQINPEALRLIETIAARTADRIVASRDQQRVAARSMGIDPDVLEEMAPAISAAEQHVPANIRGTKEGAMAALLMAAGQEAMQTGDLGTVLRKLVGTTQEEPKPARPQTLLPPSARMTTPRGAPETTRSVARARGPRDTANESFHKDGIEGDVIAVLQRERKPKVGRY